MVTTLTSSSLHVALCIRQVKSGVAGLTLQEPDAGRTHYRHTAMHLIRMDKHSNIDLRLSVQASAV